MWKKEPKQSSQYTHASARRAVYMVDNGNEKLVCIFASQYTQAKRARAFSFRLGLLRAHGVYTGRLLFQPYTARTMYTVGIRPEYGVHGSAKESPATRTWNALTYMAHERGSHTQAVCVHVYMAHHCIHHTAAQMAWTNRRRQRNRDGSAH